MTPRVWVAAVWATLIGALTFAAGPLAMLSDHKLVAAVQIVLTSILLPGLILAAEVGSLGPAASVNAVIHFGICFFVLRFLPLQKDNALTMAPAKPALRKLHFIMCAGFTGVGLASWQGLVWSRHRDHRRPDL